jgi:hypothetical protein
MTEQWKKRVESCPAVRDPVEILVKVSQSCVKRWKI